MSLRLLYGGTFDPVHTGHLALARSARDALAANLHFLPAADPPHRGQTGASGEQRAAMLALAIAGERGFSLDRRELARPGPSYTVDTLSELRDELGPAAPLAWLLGADAFRGLPSWHRWPRLFELAHFVVAVRSGHGLDALPAALAEAAEGRWTDAPPALSEAPAGRLFRLAFSPRPESASAIRQALAAGGGDRGWLSPAVAGYIRDHRLYRRAV